MTTPEPSCPNSYPNIQTNSNAFAYFTSQTQHHPSPSSQPVIHDRNIQFLRRLIAALLLTFVLISAISIISWLILHPRVPVVRVDSLSVANFNLSSSQLTASYEVKFTVRNLNRKINLEVESLRVSVLYKRNRLSRGLVQPFDVRKMNQTGVKVEFGTNASNGFPVWKKGAAVEMGRELRELGVVSLKLRMGGLVKFKAAKWLTKQSSIDVFCDNLEVGFRSDNNNLTGNPRTTSGKDCSVYLL